MNENIECECGNNDEFTEETDVVYREQYYSAINGFGIREYTRFIGWRCNRCGRVIKDQS